MPLLNRVELIGFLAAEPEMALTFEGLPYCLFSMKISQRNPDGEVTEEYIQPLAYDDVAVKIARDFHIGDVIYVSGSLSVTKWEDKATQQERKKVVVIVDDSDRLATGNGTVPPLTVRDMEAASRTPFKDGEEPYVSSVTFAKKGTTLQRVPQRHRFPQPNADGSWKLPEGMPNKATELWLAQQGVNVEAYKMKVKANLEAQRNLKVNRQVSEAQRLVQMMVPYSLQPRNGNVRLPNRRYMKEDEYFAKVRRQHDFMAAQTPEFRQTLIAEAAKIGLVIEPWWYGIPPGQDRMAYLSLFTEDGRLVDPRTKKEALRMETVKGGASRNVAPPAVQNQTTVNQHTTAEDWYQDKETGEWKLKEK